ncbi:hypothetical protein [Defluviicoccus vanus]|uniref:Uncharacterized protein n=1 Tax=Defluviicoccus vanus TaxID=111831 RepID=A0A7H1N5C5_9PROT|nr:hypothetical protein [Defluviicoccus vanus]QNT70911.1 hypothetical protein HQ394_18330 [Defluviicoccus vanus]
MIAPALRLVLIAAAGATAGWLGSSFWRRTHNAETDATDGAARARTGDERRIQTVVWCETCHAHMALEHSCEAAGVRKVPASGPATPLSPLVGDLSAG